ncbi:uncharacterized protein [Nicotiana sylvestris]|uniref:uncharacterized protein n=1 Tax=Nicotiana sylvestris TaxID=4096 RepID=UPI00388C4EE3
MVASWGETLNEDSEDEAGDEQALMSIGESDDEQEIINNENEELSRECMILKAKCKNLEFRANKSESENTELKNQVLELDTSVLELRSENLKRKLVTGKKKVDHTHLTLEENLGKRKDELYRKDEQIRVLKEDLGKKNLETLRNQLASIRSDHGTEFENAKFAEFCDETEESVHVVFDETNILSERHEHEDEAIGLVKDLIEALEQVKVAPKEGIGDGTGCKLDECNAR